MTLNEWNSSKNVTTGEDGGTNGPFLLTLPAILLRIASRGVIDMVYNLSLS